MSLLYFWWSTNHLPFPHGQVCRDVKIIKKKHKLLARQTNYFITVSTDEAFSVKLNDSKVLFWPLFLLFRLFNNTVDNKQMFYIQVSQRMDSNCEPPVAEATTLPTAPQPLPNDSKMFITIFWLSSASFSVFLKRIITTKISTLTFSYWTIYFHNYVIFPLSIPWYYNNKFNILL